MNKALTFLFSAALVIGPSALQPQRADATSPCLVGQYLLRSHGYTISVDGICGKQTRKIVLLWQKQNGLKADGVIGPVTLRSLMKTTPTRPAKTVTVVTVSVGVEQWHQMALTVGWPESAWPRLSCIMQRESRGNPSAKNRNSSATGLLQILASHHPNDDLFDPATNLSVGLAMWQTSGWQPWALPSHPC